MTPTKLLIGQILVVFAIVIGGVWTATQWCAAALGYQAQLGPAWLLVFGVPIYRPWQLFPWWYFYDAYAPHIFDKAGMIAASSGFMGIAAAIIGSLWRARQTKLVTTYGSSRWATIFLNDYARANDPFAAVGTRSVSVQVSSVVRASDTSFQVKWTEQTYEHGSLAKTERWTGILTTIIQIPRNAEVLRKNPLGLYVNGIAWTREIDPASSTPNSERN